MLQVLHLNVSKVVRALHLPPCLPPALAEHSLPPPSLLGTSDIWGSVSPTWARKMALKIDCRHGRSDAPSVRTVVVPYFQVVLFLLVSQHIETI